MRRNQEELFEAPLDVGPPTLDDLAAVCREDGVDYVAVPEAFDAPCAADNGRIYVYDCREVRADLEGRIYRGRRPSRAGEDTGRFGRLRKALNPSLVAAAWWNQDGRAAKEGTI